MSLKNELEAQIRDLKNNISGIKAQIKSKQSLIDYAADDTDDTVIEGWQNEIENLENEQQECEDRLEEYEDRLDELDD